jgi:caffeoyl-CoA O-methyltransferase
VTTRTRLVEPQIGEYAAAHTSGPDDVQRELHTATAELTGDAARMQIGDDQALFMEMLARATGARRAVEVGTFTGASALAVARGMGPEGRLLCCDINEEWTAIARRYWERAGVADRIDLRIGPALDTLRSLPAEEQFDLAFVDADKRGYGAYYEELVPRLRPEALLLVDNTLWGGRVVDQATDDQATVAIREFNDRVAGDPRVRVVVLPIGDGVSLIQRRP